MGNKLLTLFGDKLVLVRTSSFALDEEGNEGMMMYQGYLLDADDIYVYMSSSPDHKSISTAIKLDSIEEVNLAEERTAPVIALARKE